MKYFILTLALPIMLGLTGCAGRSGSTTKNTTPPDSQSVAPRTVTTAEVKDKTFDQLFCTISAKEIPESIFKLVGEDYTVITAGQLDQYNSMTASWGGVGIMFNKPVAWQMLRANRFTLEKMREYKSYTLCYFDGNFKDQVMFFGSKSGRDSDKMKKHTLTAVLTPDGAVAFKEAKLIIQCRLTEVTSVAPDDFLDESAQQFVNDAFQEAKAYHKLVFGEITDIWKRK